MIDKLLASTGGGSSSARKPESTIAAIPLVAEAARQDSASLSAFNTGVQTSTFSQPVPVKQATLPQTVASMPSIDSGQQVPDSSATGGIPSSATKASSSRAKKTSTPTVKKAKMNAVEGPIAVHTTDAIGHPVNPAQPASNSSMRPPTVIPAPASGYAHPSTIPASVSSVTPGQSQPMQSTQSVRSTAHVEINKKQGGKKRKLLDISDDEQEENVRKIKQNKARNALMREQSVMSNAQTSQEVCSLSLYDRLRLHVKTPNHSFSDVTVTATSTILVPIIEHIVYASFRSRNGKTRISHFGGKEDGPRPCHHAANSVFCIIDKPIKHAATTSAYLIGGDRGKCRPCRYCAGQQSHTG